MRAPTVPLPETAPEHGRGGGRRRWLRARWLIPLLPGTLIVRYVAVTYPAYRSAMRKARAELAAGSEVVSTRAGPIEYAEAGHGPAVLVVHGVGADLWRGREHFTGHVDHRVEENSGQHT